MATIVENNGNTNFPHIKITNKKTNKWCAMPYSDVLMCDPLYMLVKNQGLKIGDSLIIDECVEAIKIVVTYMCTNDFVISIEPHIFFDTLKLVNMWLLPKELQHRMFISLANDDVLNEMFNGCIKNNNILPLLKFFEDEPKIQIEALRRNRQGNLVEEWINWSGVLLKIQFTRHLYANKYKNLNMANLDLSPITDIDPEQLKGVHTLYCSGRNDGITK